ncbi:hypothetical protein Hamer_G026511, partial [Homarus americanus]
GGPQIEITYTAIEDAILQLLDPASIHGIPGDVESEEPITEEEREPTPGPSGARFTASCFREEFMFRLVQEKDDSITLILNEDIQEHDITVPIVHLEPETSAPTNIPGFSSSGTYEVEKHVVQAILVNLLLLPRNSEVGIVPLLPQLLGQL